MLGSSSGPTSTCSARCKPGYGLLVCPPDAKGRNGGHGRPSCTAPTRRADLDLKILDALLEAAQGAQLLAHTLSRSGEQEVGVDAIRRRLLVGLASRGLVHPSGGASRHRAESDADDSVLTEEADPPWEITEKGRALVEPHIGVARAPYDRGVGDEEVDDARDVAGLVVLLLIALLTAVCAAYSLLTATGVL